MEKSKSTANKLVDKLVEKLNSKIKTKDVLFKGGEDEKEKALDRTIKDIEKRLQREGTKENFAEMVERYADNQKFRLEHFTDQSRKELLKMMIEKIVYYSKDRIEVSGNVPLYNVTEKDYKGEAIPFVDSMVTLGVSRE